MRRRTRITSRPATLCAAALAAALSWPGVARAAGDAALFNDSHFHLTNYIQKGTTIRDYIAMMGEQIGRSTLFGIPLQQTWAHENSGNFAPTYYLQSDAPLYYYAVGSSRVDLQACKLEYSIVSPK